MAPATPLLRIAIEFSIAPANIRASLLGASPPAAKSNHFVVLGPVGEGVVGSMDAYKTATGTNEIGEGGLSLFGPGLTVVVRNDHIVVVELGLEAGHITTTGWSGCDVDRKPSRALQGGFDQRGGFGPLVVILSIDDQRLKNGLSGGAARKGNASQGSQQGEAEEVFHGRGSRGE